MTVSFFEQNHVFETKRKRRNQARLVKRLKGVKHFSTDPVTALVNGGLGSAREPSSEYLAAHLSGSECRFNKPGKGSFNVPQRTRVSENSFSVLTNEDDGNACSRQVLLRRRAKKVVSYLANELSLVPVRELQDLIQCGEFRHAVRKCFADDLPIICELSIKTSSKVESSCCKTCRPRFEAMVDNWKEQRFIKVEYDPTHLADFKKAFRGNIPKAWNKHKSPYIPNGHATERFKRRDGGNWNLEEYSEECRVELVFSSGKPRVVTCYSAYNTAILTPLHRSLYSEIKRKGWLLVGSPTDESVLNLNGGGEYLSFDYVGATDNIKAVYVQAAVQALIEEAVGLTEEEVRCLRVLSSLKFGDERECHTGQPMGSVMSFPLLCLINKTVVDMALSSLLTEGKISFKEWTSHRCLINGDDLLLKEPRPGVGLRDRVRTSAAAVGMKVNEEKTLVCTQRGEINSTLFINGCKQKKVNASALFMRSEVTDVLGFALESTLTVAGFRRVVRANLPILCKQEKKRVTELPWKYQAVCRKDRRIRNACLAEPSLERTPVANFFTLSPRPNGYDLDIGEEIALITDRVSSVRQRACAAAREKTRVRRVLSDRVHSWRSVMKKEPKRAEEKILTVLARGWEKKIKERLVELDGGLTPAIQTVRVSDQSLVTDLLDSIRVWRDQRRSYETPCLPAELLPGSFAACDFMTFD